MNFDGPGRWRDFTGEQDVSCLTPGLDLRLPPYRRALFKAFYAFHCKYLAHPGCVYSVLKHLQQKEGWDLETSLWAAAVQGNTQHPVTTWLILKEFPALPRTVKEHERLETWFNANWYRLEFDTDRRHHKSKFGTFLESYCDVLGRQTQADYFTDRVTVGGSPEGTFRELWKVVRRDFYGMGRLSTFSYLEYLRILGLPVQCDNLFLEDWDGSRSHRNGLCLVLGRDDLDWKDKDAPCPHTAPAMLAWLNAEAELLLKECQDEFGAAVPFVDKFTLESNLCCFKGTFRKDRRYANVYSDLFHDRICRAQVRWPEVDFSIFWDSRQYLPAHLRLEDNPCDVGCKPAKQNHFRLTGQVVGMSHDYPWAQNDYDESVRLAQGGLF